METFFKQYLHSRGYKQTSGRLAVFNYLLRHNPTPINRLVSAHADSADRATIYRTLTLLKRLGVIQEVVSGGKKMVALTDRFDSHHHHYLSCSDCDTSFPIADHTIEKRLRELARQHGITPTSHQVELTGVCANCRH